MTKKQEMKQILNAIKSVKFRAMIALGVADTQEYNNLMHDLLALEVCLVGAAEGFFIEDEQKVA